MARVSGSRSCTSRITGKMGSVGEMKSAAARRGGGNRIGKSSGGEIGEREPGRIGSSGIGSGR